MHFRSLLCLVLAGLLLPALARSDDAPAAAASINKPRLVVLTDISNEPDDEESLVRLLVYSNEFEIEGLIATTSVWLKAQVRPELITRTVKAYGEARSNLLLHAPGFPSVEQLLAGVKASRPEFGMAGVGDGKNTAGSDWIIHLADRPEARPLWISVWGGANCLAQALWDVKRDRSPVEVRAFVARLRVYAISDQDDSGYWIRRTFPELFYIVSPTTVNDEEYPGATWSGISGDRLHRNGPGDHFEMVDNPWLEEHIRRHHGPLGELYPKFAYLMEGDTPSFLNLIGNGLAGAENPGWGGWGGRYILRQPHGETRPIWTNSRDTVRLADGSLHTSNQATIWRWREAFQNDFAARMDWCVKARAQANHNPDAVVSGVGGREPLRVTGKPGEILRLSATGSTDPDGDALTYHWFCYPEAGSPSKNPEQVVIENAETDAAAVRLPEGEWSQLHVILEVKDKGRPPLVTYRRVIIERAAAR